MLCACEIYKSECKIWPGSLTGSSLHPGVLIGAGKFDSGDNPVVD